MGTLDGKAAIVTGGGGLLGAEFSRALAREGARVLVNDVDAERAEAVVQKIQASGGEAVVDVRSVDSWDGAGEMVAHGLDVFGRVDTLVTCAHQTRFGAIWKLREKDYDATLDVHLKGHFACVHHASRAMVEQGSGSIVTVCSRALNGLPGVSTYAAAKGGILSATFSWALELADHGIRVNAINPAAQGDEETATRHMRWHWDFSIDKVGWTEPVPTAASVAPLVVYLACDDADWITGQVLFLSGDTLALLRHPREERFGFKPDGWSREDLQRYFKDTDGASLEMPGMDVPRYPWYDGVKG